jgi:WD40 repeat protein
MPAIFISYRRGDSQDVTGRIYDRLVARFSAKQVFKDVDSIPLGVSFPRHIQQVLSRAGVVLVIIGPGWLGASDGKGRRLDDPNDFVRLEVEAALRGGMPVIPILVSNAPMPPAGELPRSLQPLVARNGMAIRPDPDFNNDIGRLFAGLENLDKLLRVRQGPEEVKPSPVSFVLLPEDRKPRRAPNTPQEGNSRRPQAAVGPAPPRPLARGTTATWLAVGTVGLLLLAVGLWLALRPATVSSTPADGDLTAYNQPGRANNVHFGPDGPRAVLWPSIEDKRKHFARVYDVATGRPVSPPLAAEGVPISFASFSADGKRVVTATYAPAATARVWDAQTGQPLSPPVTHDSWIYSPAFSPDGRRVVTPCHGGKVRVWDAETGRDVFPPIRHDKTVMVATFSPDGNRLVTASYDKTARVWDANTGKPVSGPLKHEGEVRDASFSPDGTRVLTVSFDHTGRVWDATTGQPVTPPLKHDAQLQEGTFSPDGKRVATASWDQTARVWDAATGQPVTPPLKHEAALWMAWFSRDGKRLVTAGSDRTARVWDADTGRPVTPPLKHASVVCGAFLTPDGKQVITCTTSGPLLLWDLATGRELRRIVISTNGVSPVGKGAEREKEPDFKKGIGTSGPDPEVKRDIKDTGKPPPKPAVKEAIKKGAARFNPRPGMRAGQVVLDPLGMRFARCPPDSFTMQAPSDEQARYCGNCGLPL